MLSRKALGDDLVGRSAQRAADRIAAQWEHHAGRLAPPDSQIENLLQAAGGIGELALVDDQSGLEFARLNRRDDLVKGNGLGLQFRIEDLERKIGGCHFAGNGNLDAAQIFQRQRPARDDHGAVALAHAAAAAHQRIVLL